MQFPTPPVGDYNPTVQTVDNKILPLCSILTEQLLSYQTND